MEGVAGAGLACSGPAAMPLAGRGQWGGLEVVAQERVGVRRSIGLWGPRTTMCAPEVRMRPLGGRKAIRDERLALLRSGHASLTADRRVTCTAGTPAWSEYESLAADGRVTTNGWTHMRTGYGSLAADRRADANGWTIRDPNASCGRRMSELGRTAGPWRFVSASLTADSGEGERLEPLVVRIRLPGGGTRVKMNGWTTQGPDTPSWWRIASEDERLDHSGCRYACLAADSEWGSAAGPLAVRIRPPGGGWRVKMDG